MADDTHNSTDITTVSILGKNTIHCGFHLVPYIVRTVVETIPASTYVLITDTSVANHYLDKFEDEFASLLTSKASTSRFLAHLIPPGETSKSREGKASIEDYLLSQSCTRDTVILALGGGVIGDLVGFVAATFMRGVRLVQIPTTLLAMVDSSVGGKTAIDTPHGKNLIGAFWEPEYIFIDAAFLETLPLREFSNGMAEVVKTAAIWNEDEFSALESQSAEVFAAIQTTSLNNAGRTKATRSETQELLLRVIIGSISVKAHICTVDERETGLRNLVNFGHTIGHAIEAVLTPTILHGECVSIGMILEAEVARSMGILSQVAVGRLTRALKAYNLPTSVKDPRISAVPASKLLTVDRLLDIMKLDKKNAGPAKKVVLLSRIGATYEPKATVVSDNIIRKSLSDAVKVISAVPKNSPVTMATPGSKSISNRALVLAALAGGTCRLKNLLHSDDTQVMMAALNDLKGATFSWENNGDTLVVHGGGGSLVPPPVGKEIYLQNAGTAARFLTTVCALVRSPEGDKHTIVTGNARMNQRPIGPLVDALRANGTEIAYQQSEGCLPLKVTAHKDGFAGGYIKLAASVSSQYVSSILLCAPYAREAVVLELIGGQVISQPYIDMTVSMMHTFGVQVIRRKDVSTGKLLDIYDIPNVPYSSPPVYSIESDASSATYPLAIAAITGTTCTLENIGSASLQGDAGFAKGVLEPMGCKVVQTEHETTVTGPPVGQLRAIGLVDMEPMTDAFLTASVLAAVAGAPALTERSVGTESGLPNTTRILGIANQRVKECNRIKAMIDELAKFGVETKEFDDGLEIYGRPIEELKTGVSVHCYDDHRVGMAFSVLGSVIKGTILEEKRCVEKTWPNWWDDLENKIGLSVEGVDLHAEVASTSQSNKRPDASVLLVGMRGAGKSYIGRMAASELGWEYLDADAFLEQRHWMTCKEYVHQKGWEAFRTTETAILSELLELKPEKTIIALGGGIVETHSARDVLKEYKARRGPIVHISRDIKEIVHHLTEETDRPAYGEEIEEVYNRRRPWFHECSSHEFVSLTTTGDMEGRKGKTKTRAAIRTFFGHITGLSPNLVDLNSGRKSYFLSLTFPDIAAQRPLLDDSLGDAAVLAGIDAVELRVDLLSPSGPTEVPNAPSIEYVTQQLALLRHFTTLPIVYTVRTAGQGGAFPDGREDHLFGLLDSGLRLGAEYIDVETTLPHTRIRELARCKGSSKIIASYHDWSGKMSWSGTEVQAQYAMGTSLGDVVKIVGKANTIEDNFTLRGFVQKHSTSRSAKPLIAINMGAAGQLSRILNTTFTPVTHPALSVAAAPGQLSVSQINSALHLAGQIPAKRFYLFGDPIGQSPSPTLHDAAFKALGLPHKYCLYPSTTESLEALKSIVRSPDFGGASVTIPLKLAIIPLLDTLSHAGRIIGAINTVAPVTSADGGIELYGDNTDWIGIQRAILARSIRKWSTSDVGLIIGAGGTARAAIYALHQLGLGKILIYNRTRETAKTIIAGFPISFNIHVMEDLKDLEKEPPAIVVGTVPASATTSDAKGEGLFLSNTIFSHPEGGIVVDMAYRPHKTPLLELAGQISGQLWQQVPGVEVLLEQGYEQFSLWTGSKPPVKIVEKAVLSFYHALPPV